MGFLMLARKINPMYAGIAVAVIGLSLYIGTVVYGLKGVIADQKVEIGVLRDVNRELEVDLIVETAQSEMFKSAIDESNQAIDVLSMEADEARLEYDKWVSQPPEIKYGDVIKYLPAKDSNQSQCDYLQDTLDNIAKVGYENN